MVMVQYYYRYMGQSTDANIGVSVSLSLTHPNIKQIYSLLELAEHPLTLFISGLRDEDEWDEVINCDYDYDAFDVDVLDELVNLKTEQEFKTKCDELEIKTGLVFHFMFVCAGIYCRNLSFRSNPYVFNTDETGLTPMQLIEHIQKGIQVFKNANIPDELIKVGNTMREG